MPAISPLYLVATLVIAILLHASARAELEPALWQGRSGGFDVRWTAKDIYVRAGKAKFKPLFAGGFLSGINVEPGCRVDGELKIVSLVGDYLSYEKTFEKNCAGRREPLKTVTRGVLRLGRTRRPAKLTDLYEEAVLTKALLANPIIHRSLERNHDPAATRNLASLMRSLSHFVIVYDVEENECRASLEQVLQGFAFEKKVADGVSYRLFLELDGTRACQSNPLEVSLILPTVDKVKRPMSRAESGAEGFLMDQAATITQGAVCRTSVETPCGAEPTEYCPLKNGP